MSAKSRHHFLQGVLSALTVLASDGLEREYRMVADSCGGAELWDHADEHDREHLQRFGYAPSSN